MSGAPLPVLPPPGTPQCRLDEIPDGGGHVVTVGDGSDALGAVLLRDGEKVIAWHNRCPHFGQPLAKRDEWLIVRERQSLSCNVHYARFDWHDGTCTDGDCVGDRLTAIPVEIRSGMVVVASPAGEAGTPGS